MVKRLRSGFIDEIIPGPIAALPAPQLMRRALLVYEGEFGAMDGPVEVTREQLLRLVANHNAYIDHCQTLVGSGMPLPMKDFPPIQLDHSTSAHDTVGRLMGKIELAPYIRKDGKEVLGVYGDTCILGAENCEKASDGRWTHLSVGVDFEKGTFSELTITPFPAAPEASMLAGVKMSGVYVGRGFSGTSYYFEKGKIYDEDGNHVGRAPGVGEAKRFVVENYSQLSKGEHMDEQLRAKLKKRLTEKENLSEEDAEKKLSHLSSEEGKEELSKLTAEVEKEELSAEEEEKARLAAEEEEKARLAAEESEKEAKLAAEKEEADRLAAEEADKEKETKLSAARENITRLSADFRKLHEGAQLSARKGIVITRLSALRAQAKITPAEIKKLEIDKLAAGKPEVMEAVLKSYEDREPVIMTGQLGSLKATDLSKLSKSVRMSKLEEETRANMSLLKGTVATDRLKKSKMEDVNVHIDTTPHNHYELEGACTDIEKLMDEGRNEEAKLKLRETLKKSLSKEGEQLSAEDTEKQLSALAETVNKMQAQYEELSKLAGSLVGLK